MNKEEIEFLREHIEGICRYKGLQQELTYDVSLDVLQRIYVALDYLQQKIDKTMEIIELNQYSYGYQIKDEILGGDVDDERRN